jgi:hypothetical protein
VATLPSTARGNNYLPKALSEIISAEAWVQMNKFLYSTLDMPPIKELIYRNKGVKIDTVDFGPLKVRDK